MKFINKEINFKSLYLRDKLKVNKRIVFEKEKYDIFKQSQKGYN